MGKVGLFRSAIADLENRKAISNKNKKKIQDKLQQLKDDFVNRIITKSEYDSSFNNKIDGKTLKEWHETYEDYEKKCEGLIRENKKKVIKKKVARLGIFFVLFFLIIGFSFFILPKINFSSLAGFLVFTQDKEVGTFSESVDFGFSESSVYYFKPSHFGDLKSLRFNGAIETFSKDSRIKISIINPDDNSEILVLDSDKLSTDLKKQSENLLLSSNQTGNVNSTNSSELPSSTNLSSSKISGFAIGIPEETSQESNSMEGSPAENTTNLSQQGSPTFSIPESNESFSEVKEGALDNLPQYQQGNQESLSSSEQTSESFNLTLEDLCTDNCDLSNYGLSESEYQIKIEIISSNKPVLQLESISYDLGALSERARGFLVSSQTVANESSGRNIKGYVDVSSCQVLSSPDTTYVLTQNLTTDLPIGGSCINVTANNTLFDMRGYSINQANSYGTGVGYGILANSVNNFTVMNGFTYRFGYGFYSTYISNSTIANMTFDSASGRGVEVDSAYNLTIKWTTSKNNSGAGFFLKNLQNSSIFSSDSYSNEVYGFQMFRTSSYSHGNSMINLSDKFTSGTGFYITNQKSGNFTNIISENSFGSIYESGIFLMDIYNSYWYNLSLINCSANSGLKVSFSDNNRFFDVSAFNNSAYGVYISSSDNNTFTNIVANNNSAHGVYLDSSDNNLFENITSNDNVDYGVYVEKSINNSFVDVFTANNAPNIVVSHGSNNSFDNVLSNFSKDIGIHVLYCPGFKLSNSSVIFSKWEGIVVSSPIYNIILKNLTLNNNLDGLRISSSQGFSFQNALFEDINSSNNSQYGVSIRGDDGRDFNNNTFRNLVLDYNGAGIVLSESSNNTLVNISSKYNSGAGFSFENSFHNPSNTLIASFNNIGFLITNLNNFSEFSTPATSNKTLSSIYNLVAINNSQYGVYVSESINNHIENAIISYNNFGGIYLLRNFRNNSFNNITLANNSRYGIYLGNGTNTVLSNLKILNCSVGYSCAYFNSSIDSTVINLTANSSSESSIPFYVINSRNLALTNNEFYSYGKNSTAVYIYNSTNNPFQNISIKTYGANSSGIVLNITNNTQIYHSTLNISGGDSHGIIFVNNSNTNKIWNNTIDVYGNRGKGLYFDYCSLSTKCSNLVNVTSVKTYGAVSSEALFINRANNFLEVMDSVLNASASNIADVNVSANLGSGVGVFNLTNVTLFDYYFDSASTASALYFKWWVYANVSNGTAPFQSAKVDYYDKDFNLVLTQYTNNKGLTSKTAMIESNLTSIGRTLVTNHTINSTFSSLKNQSSINLTFEKNYLHHAILSVTITPPLVTINSPSNITNSSRSVVFNVTTDIDSFCWLTLYNASEEYLDNYTMQANGLAGAKKDFNYTNASIADGGYLAQFNCNESAMGVINSSQTRWFSIDSTPPLVVIFTPLNMTYPFNNFTALVTTNEDATCVYSLDYGANNLSLNLRSYTETTYTFNYTNLSISDGSYVMRVFCNDTLGNMNDTVNRTFSINTTGNFMNLTIVTPTNTTYAKGTSSIEFRVENNGATFIQDSCTLHLNSEIGRRFQGYFDDVHRNYSRSLVLLYHFNNESVYGENNTRVYDFSGHQNNLTFSTQGNITPTLNGKIKGGIDFYGDSYNANNNYLQSLNKVNVTNSSGFTVSVWLKPRNASTSGSPPNPHPAQGIIGTKDLSSNSGFYIREYYSSPVFYSLEYGLGLGNPSSATPAYNLRSWKHVVATYNPITAEAYLYVNGVQAAVIDPYLYNLANLSWNSEILIGIDSSGQETLNGTLDEVAMWNRSLSAGEVFDLYEAQKGMFLGYIDERMAISLNSTMTSGVYRAWIWCDDYFGIVNNTVPEVIFSISGTEPSPNINFTNPTPETNSLINANSLFINISSNDTTWIGDDSDHSVVVDFNRTLSGWWRLNSAGAVTDASTYGNTGTNNGATYTSSGKFGSAYNFTGDAGISQYLDLTLSGFNSTAGTISFWAKASSLNTPNPFNIYLLARESSGLSTGEFSFYLNAVNNVVFKFLDNSSGIKQINSNLPVSDNYWHHYIGVWNGSELALYVDALKQGSTATSSFMSLTDVPGTQILVGQKQSQVVSENWNGSIDDIQIYSRALNLSEIRALYNASTYQYFNNFTGLTGGNYTVIGYAQDLAGNVNSTEMRVFNISTTPIINYVSPISTVDLIESNIKNIEFYFSVFNPAGYGYINTTSAIANFSNGSTTRSNLSCKNLNDIDTYTLNFSCTIGMWYWDTNGTWNIGVYIEDNNTESAQNFTTNFQIGALTAFVIHPNSSSSGLSWSDLNPGSTNSKSTSDPIIINNTGNVPIASGNIQINTTDLIGESDGSKRLYAGNFSVHTNDADVCTLGTNMTRSLFANITGAVLPAGNNTAGEGVEELYVCLKEAGWELTPQSYSTSGPNSEGFWTIRIMVVMLSLRKTRSLLKKGKKRKENLEKENLFKMLKLAYAEISLDYSDEKADIAKRLNLEIRKKYRIGKQEISEIIGLKKSFDEIKIPLSVFTKDIGGLEALVRYLKENYLMSYSEIARLLVRDERTIWSAYAMAKKKTASLRINLEGTYIPLSLFVGKRQTVLELLIKYLKEALNKRYVEIAEFLGRDQRNIWTIYHNTLAKSASF